MRAGRMIPMKYIDNVLVFVAFTFLTGALNASLTTFDSTVGGANSAGNLNMQMFSMAIYVPTVFLIFYRIEKFVNLVRNNLLLFLFFLLPLFSVFWSIAPELSARRIIAFTGTTLFICYTAIALTPERVIRILAVAFAAIAIVCVVFAVALPGLGTHEAGPYAGVWRGLFTHKNRLGGMMVLAAVTLFLCPKYSRNEKRASNICIAIAVFLVVMSQSKTALLAFFVLSTSILALLWLAGRRSKSFERAIFVFLFGAISVSLLANNSTQILEMLGKEPTLTGRTDTWELAWDNVKNRPLLGHGYRVFWSDRSPARLGNFEGWRDNISHSHNTYLDLLLDLGFVGFLSFLFIIVVFIRKMSHIIYEKKDRSAIWMISFVIYMIFVGITEKTVLEQSDIVWSIFILSIFIVSREKRTQKSHEGEFAPFRSHHQFETVSQLK